MASRRGRSQDQRCEALAVAGNQRERRRLGHPRTVTPRHLGRQTVHAQAFQAMGPAAGNGDRQARILLRREGAGCPMRRAPSSQGDQQRGGSIASAYPLTREGDEPVHVAATGPAVSVGPRPDRPHLPLASSPPLRKLPSSCKTRRIRPMGRLHGRNVRLSGRRRDIGRPYRTT